MAEGDHVRLCSRGDCQGGEGGERVDAREVKFKIRVLVPVRVFFSRTAPKGVALTGEGSSDALICRQRLNNDVCWDI